MKICPKCGNKTFLVAAHIVQEWKVDENEEFIEVTEDCICVSHRPDNEDIWICEKCGYKAAGEAFESKGGDE